MKTFPENYFREVLLYHFFRKMFALSVGERNAKKMLNFRKMISPFFTTLLTELIFINLIFLPSLLKGGQTKIIELE